MRTLASVLFLLLSFTASAETTEKDFKASPGQKLDVDLKTGGALTIVGWDKDAVKVKYTIRGRDAEDCRVDVSQEAGSVNIRSEYEGRRNHHESDIDFEISVPHKFDLTLFTMGGGIRLDNIAGEIEGKTMGGRLDLTKLKGTLELTTMGGRVNLTDSDVDGYVKTMGGAMNVENVTGDVKATSMGGKVTQKNVRPRSGAGIRDEVNIRTMGGDIDVDDAPEGADVHTMGGDIHIVSANKYARVKTMGGNIDIDAIDGSVQAVTMGGDINVKMTGDPSKGERDIAVESMGGDVTVVVPASLSMDLDLTLVYTRDARNRYEIVSDFDMKQESTQEWERGKGSSRKYIYGTGTVAGGKHKVRIKTVNGNIYLKKG